MTYTNDQIINDCTVVVGGEAGYGVMSIGVMIAYAASRGGLYVFCNPEYPSLIRGGHNSYLVRMRDIELTAHHDAINILMALNKESIDMHLVNIVEDGIIIYDAEEITREDPTFDVKGDDRFKNVPLKKLALENGKNILMRNTVALGATMAFLDYDTALLTNVLTDNFKRKGEAIVQANIDAAMAGYSYVKEHYDGESKYILTRTGDEPRCLMDGNEATAMGAIRAGVSFIAAYPMTPATSIWQIIGKYVEKYNIVVKQTEDEIAAMNMIIGAGHAGARAMTATSGGGFSLMVEALGMAGMTETPIVVVNSQRPGPSTGFPTRSEQGDLRFMMHASQGEFPRVVMAPGTLTQAFEMMGEAFNLADKYQMPVIVLLDKYFSANKQTSVSLDQSNITIDRGELLGFDKKVDDYKRYRYTESGISPRSLPGSPNISWASTDEHIEEGHLREDELTRTMMVEKRARKLALAAQEIKGYVMHGAKDADELFLLWGSSLGAALEAQNILNTSEGKNIAILQITHMIPFNTDEITELIRDKNLCLIEGNSEGQLGQVIQEHTLVPVKKRILRYDGRGFTPEYIINRYHEL